MLLIDCNRDLSANSWGRKYEGGASKQRGRQGRQADTAESEVDTKERSRHRLKYSSKGKNLVGRRLEQSGKAYSVVSRAVSPSNP